MGERGCGKLNTSQSLGEYKHSLPLYIGKIYSQTSMSQRIKGEGNQNVSTIWTYRETDWHLKHITKKQLPSLTKSAVNTGSRRNVYPSPVQDGCKVKGKRWLHDCGPQDHTLSAALLNQDPSKRLGQSLRQSLPSSTNSSRFVKHFR